MNIRPEVVGVHLRLLALKAGERPFLMRRHQSLVLDVNRFDFSSSCASCMEPLSFLPAVPTDV